MGRKKKAEKSRQVDTWSNTDDCRDSLFTNVLTAAQKNLGRDDIIVGSSQDKVMLGLPLRHLSLRHLFRSNVYPLSRTTQVVGPEGSAKSSMLFEMAKWHLASGGGFILAENEGKDAPTLRNSLWEWNKSWLNRVQIIPTYCMEDWQQVFSTYIRILQEKQDAKDGPGRTIPVCFAVDSLMATLPRAMINKMHDEGYASLSHPIPARLISDYMRGIPELLKDYPFSIIGTNHLKDGTDSMGRPVKNVPGGRSVKFMETFEIHMRRIGDIDLLNEGGLRVRFDMQKNCAGPSRRTIIANLLWRHETIDGELRQISWWDWDAATIDMIESFASASGKKTLYNRLTDICDIHKTKKDHGWSDTLGIPSSDPQHYRVLGAELEKRPDLISQMHEVLAIPNYSVFAPGDDYLVKQQEAVEKGSTEAAVTPEAHEFLEPDDDNE